MRRVGNRRGLCRTRHLRLIQVLQARRLREEQARLFVIVDFEAGFLVYLTVENIGRTMARDVTIRFDKPLESTLSGPREIDESPLLRKPIPTLPPGSSAYCSTSTPPGWTQSCRSLAT
jgi:hypothetical protein